MSRIHLAPLALLVATAMAQNMNQCPNGQLSYQNNDQQWCCPGAVYGDENGTAKAFCCVGARFDVAGPSFAPCFPFCSGSDGVTVTSTTQQTCQTSVYLTDSSYSSKVSAAAASSWTMSDGRTSTTMDGTRSSAGTMPTETGNRDSSSSQAGAAMVTSGPMVGAMVFAGSVLMAM